MPDVWSTSRCSTLNYDRRTFGFVASNLGLQAATADTPHRIELAELIPRWQDRMTTWRSWMCTMTKTTLQQVAGGVSHDQLGGRSNAMVSFALACHQDCCTTVWVPVSGVFYCFICILVLC